MQETDILDKDSMKGHETGISYFSPGTPATWVVCQGSYGVGIFRSDEGHPGGKAWYDFESQKLAREAAKAISEGRYLRPPDKEWVELSAYLVD